MFYVSSSHFNTIVPSKILESRCMRQHLLFIFHVPLENSCRSTTAASCVDFNNSTLEKTTLVPTTKLPYVFILTWVPDIVIENLPGKREVPLNMTGPINFFVNTMIVWPGCWNGKSVSRGSYTLASTPEGAKEMGIPEIITLSQLKIIVVPPWKQHPMIQL